MSQVGFDWGTALPALSAGPLVLRALRDDDAPALVGIFGDVEVIRYMSLPLLVGLDDARELLRQIHDHFGARTLFQWGIARRSDDQVIGTTTLFHVDHPHGRGEIGYGLGRAHWGQGLAREAVRALIRFAFGPLGLRRLEADVDPRNAGSIRVLERAGFSREGHLRERYFQGGELQDALFYGLLRREWEGQTGS